jgi:hypothetical protein
MAMDWGKIIRRSPSESAIGSRRMPAHAFFDTNTASTSMFSKSPSVAFARVNMFKSAVVSDCLMIGNFSDLGG